MSSGSKEGYTVSREQFLKKGGQTPEYINKFIPTEPVRLRFGPSRGTATKGVGSALLMGSKYLLGSPNDIYYLAMRVRFNTSTPNVYFAVTHSRVPGTIDTPFLPSKTDDLAVTDYNSPVYSVPTGTLKVYALGPGSSVAPGKGSVIKFQGFGSSATGGASFSADLYPV